MTHVEAKNIFNGFIEGLNEAIKESVVASVILSLDKQRLSIDVMATNPDIYEILSDMLNSNGLTPLAGIIAACGLIDYYFEGIEPDDVFRATQDAMMQYAEENNFPDRIIETLGRAETNRPIILEAREIWRELRRTTLSHQSLRVARHHEARELTQSIMPG